MVEITDEESARAWLETQPHQVQVWMSARAALRALPKFVLGDFDEKHRQLLFVDFRAAVHATLAAVVSEHDSKHLPLSEIFQSTTSGFAKTHELGSSGDPLTSGQEAAVTSMFALHAAQDNTASVVQTAAILEITHDYQAFRDDAASVQGRKFVKAPWPALWSDSASDIRKASLAAWNLLAATLKKSGTWAFFIEFYEGCLHGRPLDWGLIFQIAVTLTDEDWETVESAAAAIREVENAFWAKNLPQAETLEQDPQTGKFDVSEKGFDADEAFGEWLEQIEFGLSVAIDRNSNDFNRMHTAFRYLDYTLTKCRTRPNSAEQNIGIARNALAASVADEGFISDDTVTALLGILDQIQTQLRADHPDVRKAWEKRIAQKVREADRDRKVLIAQAMRDETERTQNQLSEEFELDAEAVENADSVEAEAAAIRRAAGRSAKMNALEKTGDVVRKVDDSATYKATRIGSTAYTVIDVVRSLFGG